LIMLLERLRRRRKTVARVALPILAAVWLSASASPCLGMVAGSGAAAADTHQAHAHSPAHDSTAPSRHQPGCPHCPPAPGSQGGAALAHAGCATLENVSDSGGQSSAEKRLEQVMPVAISERATTVDLLARRPAYRVPIPVAPTYAWVPINVLHCVFLI
jgi:hypothetical protein